jgi:hypothetical protein
VSRRFRSTAAVREGIRKHEIVELVAHEGGHPLAMWTFSANLVFEEIENMPLEKIKKRIMEEGKN